jgi:hypothetical protein
MELLPQQEAKQDRLGRRNNTVWLRLEMSA